MKRNTPFVFLFFLLLIVALIFTAAHQARQDEASTTPAPWQTPKVTPDSNRPTLTPGWWGEMPTPIPFPTPTPRK
jgi:hypothetical protein